MSDLDRFVEPVAGLSRKSAPFIIEVFAWYLHEVKLKAKFSPAEIARCFDEIHISRPANIPLVMTRLCEKKPPRLIKDIGGYRLHGDARKQLEKMLPVRAASVATTALLDGLSSRISGASQQVFLSETIVCFNHHAYRAAIVMAWNLAYSHVCDRIFSAHLHAFNLQRPKVNPKLPEILRRTDFEDYGERQVIEICRGARIFDATVCKTLTDRLNRRNSAAHPSSSSFTAVQAEDMITDLANNVLLNSAV